MGADRRATPGETRDVRVVEVSSRRLVLDARVRDGRIETLSVESFGDDGWNRGTEAWSRRMAGRFRGIGPPERTLARAAGLPEDDAGRVLLAFEEACAARARRGVRRAHGRRDPASGLRGMRLLLLFPRYAISTLREGQSRIRDELPGKGRP